MVHHIEVQVLILLLIASFVGMIARRLKVPYTLALVVAGLGLGFLKLEPLRGVALTQELLMLLFLPPLLFEAAYHLPFKDVRKNAAHIVFLAVFGVFFCVAVTAVLTYAGLAGFGLMTSLTWGHAFLFGAVIAATDPISVLALFKEVGAPKRLYQLVEGESLVNDGVAVVLFLIISVVLGLPDLHGKHPALSGAQHIITFAVVTFFKTGVGGLLVGAAAGALASVITRQIDDHLIEITITTIVAWGSFLVAEQLHVSGVLSTVAAGVMMGSFGKHYGMSASTRVAVQDFWQYLGFVSNSFIFLLIGLELTPSALVKYGPLIGVGFVAVVGARALLIYGGMPLLDRIAVPVPSRWRHVMVWGGLRGSLSMVLVLGLPSSFAGRTELVHLVFGVVGASLFLQGLTVAPLMRWLKVIGDGGVATSRHYELARGRAIAARRVLVEADRLVHEGLLDEASHARLRVHYERRHQESREAARMLAGDSAQPERLLEASRTLSLVEQEAIAHTAHAGVVSESVAAELLAEIDARTDGLDRAAHEDEQTLLEAVDAAYPAGDQ